MSRSILCLVVVLGFPFIALSQNKQQQNLVKEGWRVRVYIPFGTEWYPYFMRRLGERPANVLFIARNLLRA